MASAEISPTTADPAVTGFWPRAQNLLIRTGERLNPILVKEARQAMKSRLFSITFTLVLIASWAWSFWGIARFGPGVAFQAAGPTLFLGYFFILAAAGMVIVPFGAFRSLASECEDRTFELLSITTLGPRQIVAGKLGSAALQLLVYFSALAPCLAFTYLLRGIDIVTIIVMLSYVGFISLGLSLFALLVATLSQERNWQIFLSVILIVGLVICFSYAFGLSVAIIHFESGELRNPGAWIAHAGFFTFYATSFAIFFLAAAARLTFASDNRATPLRIAMLVQAVLFIGWFAWGMSVEPQIDTEVAVIFMALAGGYWYVMGAFMTGESPELSPRVMRSLPETLVGRAFLSWFFPGPGRGYLFVLGNLLTALLLAIGVVWWGNTRVRALPYFYATPERVTLFAILLLSYATIYLGLAKLLLGAIRKRGGQVMLLGALMLHVVLITFGSFVPLILDSLKYGVHSYSLLEITNPFWTLAASVTQEGTEYAGILAVLVPAFAIAIMALNFPGLVAELRLARVEMPERVAAEEAALQAPRRPTKTNPWDGDE